MSKFIAKTLGAFSALSNLVCLASGMEAPIVEPTSLQDAIARARLYAKIEVLGAPKSLGLDVDAKISGGWERHSLEELQQFDLGGVKVTPPLMQAVGMKQDRAIWKILNNAKYKADFGKEIEQYKAELRRKKMQQRLDRKKAEESDSDEVKEVKQEGRQTPRIVHQAEPVEFKENRFFWMEKLPSGGKLAGKKGWSTIDLDYRLPAGCIAKVVPLKTLPSKLRDWAAKNVNQGVTQVAIQAWTYAKKRSFNVYEEKNEKKGKPFLLVIPSVAKYGNQGIHMIQRCGCIEQCAKALAKLRKDSKTMIEWNTLWNNDLSPALGSKICGNQCCQKYKDLFNSAAILQQQQGYHLRKK